MHITAQAPLSEMTYTVSSGTLNSTIPYQLLYICSNSRAYSNHIVQPATSDSSIISERKLEKSWLRVTLYSILNFLLNIYVYASSETICRNVQI